MSLERCILGTAGLGGVWGSVDPQESVGALLLALESGINAIDTAPAYGDAEKYVGEALRNWHGNKPQISTKAGRLKSFNASEGIYDYSDKGIWRSIEQSLVILGVNAVDILFLHEPDRLQGEDVDRIIQTLHKIKEKGYAKKIGLGGNPPDWFLTYLQPEVFDVVMEFNKLSACNTTAIIESLPYCLANSIEYFVASPLHMGLLGDRFTSYVSNPPAWLSHEILETAISAKKIADENKLDLRNLAHRFLLSLPYFFNVVVGACNRQQLHETITDFCQGPLETTLVEKLLNITKGNSLHVQDR
ncbi:MAG TPA: aldo/keto reductase [Parafilimonas sp.]|nr:aldo/keto reductase [Parafilimonas sp.]